MKNILMRLWRGRLRPALKRALRESALARLALRLAYRMVGVKVDKITPLPSGAALYTVGDMVLAMDGFRLPDPVRWEKVVLDIAAYGYRPGPGDCVLDIGAGFGEECIFFSRWVGPQGRVCAVEAIPANASVLAELARANGVTNLKILSLALGQTAGQIHLTESEFGSRTRWELLRRQISSRVKVLWWSACLLICWLNAQVWDASTF